MKCNLDFILYIKTPEAKLAIKVAYNLLEVYIQN
jgi:hypothetical protein